MSVLFVLREMSYSKCAFLRTQVLLYLDRRIQAVPSQCKPKVSAKITNYFSVFFYSTYMSESGISFLVPSIPTCA